MYANLEIAQEIKSFVTNGIVFQDDFGLDDVDFVVHLHAMFFVLLVL